MTKYPFNVLCPKCGAQINELCRDYELTHQERYKLCNETVQKGKLNDKQTNSK